MRTPVSRPVRENWQTIALDLLADKDTLAGLAHVHRVSIHQILEWKERLIQEMVHARRNPAA
jgi:hypothetical protein